MKQTHEPVALILSRQDLPTLDRIKYNTAKGKVAKGAYILADAPSGKPDCILIATGSEVYLCIDAYEKLKADGVQVRVVSMPCTELFDQQPQEYRDEVLPPTIKARVAVEQGSVYGWDRYVGDGGTIIGMHGFGKSAPAKLLQIEFGFTAEKIIAAAEFQIRKAGGK